MSPFCALSVISTGVTDPLRIKIQRVGEIVFQCLLKRKLDSPWERTPREWMWLPELYWHSIFMSLRVRERVAFNQEKEYS